MSNKFEITSQVLAILFGGHETTANFLGSILFQLDFHSFRQEKLRDKLRQNILKSTYLFNSYSRLFDNIVNECLRLNPPIYTIPRKVIEPFEVADCQISEGWYVILSASKYLSKLG